MNFHETLVRRTVRVGKCEGALTSPSYPMLGMLLLGYTIRRACLEQFDEDTKAKGRADARRLEYCAATHDLREKEPEAHGKSFHLHKG